MPDPFISIGLPVHNAGEDLRRAIDCILGQTHRNFELIISDNASTDETTELLTKEYASRDPRIRLTRQTTNCGAFPNFVWVLKQAQGDYFMWAAHDDYWSDNYVQVLVELLDTSPDACLATALTRITATGKWGEIQKSTFPSAPNQGRWNTLEVFIRYSAGTWCYGVFRREFLLSVVGELRSYPFFSADRIWLFGLILQNRIVGDDRAVFYYTSTYGKYCNLTRRVKIQSWGTNLVHTLRLAWIRLPPSQRLTGIYYAFRFYYIHQVRRGNPVGTAVRAVKLALLWSWFFVEMAFQRVLGMVTKSSAPSAGSSSNESNTPSSVGPDDRQQRRAA